MLYIDFFRWRRLFLRAVHLFKRVVRLVRLGQRLRPVFVLHRQLRVVDPAVTMDPRLMPQEWIGRQRVVDGCTKTVVVDTISFIFARHFLQMFPRTEIRELRLRHPRFLRIVLTVSAFVFVNYKVLFHDQ
jgi:hypothetical protein